MTPELQFVTEHPDAAMITIRRDGSPHVARVELGVVDGGIRSSGSPGLVRTNNVRRDHRCALFVFGPAPLWLGIEAVATILDGPDAVARSTRLMQVRHGDVPAGYVVAHDESIESDRPYPLAEYRAHVQTNGLFVFDFEIVRSYGNYRSSPTAS